MVLTPSWVGGIWAGHFVGELEIGNGKFWEIFSTVHFMIVSRNL